MLIQNRPLGNDLMKTSNGDYRMLVKQDVIDHYAKQCDCEAYRVYAAMLEQEHVDDTIESLVDLMTCYPLWQVTDYDYEGFNSLELKRELLRIEMKEHLDKYGDFMWYADDPDAVYEYSLLLNAFQTEAIGLYEDQIDDALNLLDVFHPIFFDYTLIEDGFRKTFRYVGFVDRP